LVASGRGGSTLYSCACLGRRESVSGIKKTWQWILWYVEYKLCWIPSLPWHLRHSWRQLLFHADSVHVHQGWLSRKNIWSENSPIISVVGFWLLPIF
jgi:hypothetical protein